MSMTTLRKISAIIVLLSFVLAIFFTSKHSPPASAVEHVRNVPVRKDGVIFISDGAKGSSREAAIELAKHGYHVLVGAKTDAEIRSFAFDARKGLELIKFDITNPSTYVTLVYRLRQIRRDLDRPLVGIVLNLAGGVDCGFLTPLYGSQPLSIPILKLKHNLPSFLHIAPRLHRRLQHKRAERGLFEHHLPRQALQGAVQRTNSLAAGTAKPTVVLIHGIIV